MKYLGVDWGLKKIGAAVSEGQLAEGLGSFRINSLQQGIDKIVELVREYNIELVVIGQPEGESGKLVEKAAGELKKRGLRVTLADETLSTQDSRRVMVESGVKKKKRREDDALAATIILQRFLEDNP